MEYDRFAAAMLAEYQAFANGLIADYLVRRASGPGIAAATQFRVEGLTRVTAFVQRFDALIKGYLAQSSMDAAQEALRALFSIKMREVAIKNVNDLIVILVNSHETIGSLFVQPAGAIGILMQKRRSNPILKFTDKRDSNWLAENFVKVAAREFAYAAYLNEAIAALPSDLAKIVYPDHAHANHGLIVSVSGSSTEQPSLASVRKSIFHPNSSARLIAYVPS